MSEFIYCHCCNSNVKYQREKKSHTFNANVKIVCNKM